MRLTNALADVLKLRMPEETVLITPTLGEGRRLLQVMAGAGHLIMGVRPAAVGTLAQEICAGYLSGVDAPRLMERAEAQDLMFRVLRSMPEEGFFAGEHAKDRRTAELMYGVIAELNANGIGRVSGNARQDAVQRLREAYQEAKGTALLDEADLLTLAAQLAPAFYAGKPPHFVTLSCYSFAKRERELLDAAAGDRLRIVSVSGAEGVPAPESCIGAAEETLAVDPGRIRFVRCRGEETEQRFIMRDILAHHRRAEDCAVVCMSADYETGLYAEAQFFHIPVTISGGVPLTGSPVYPVLRFLSEWAVSDYDAEKLRALILSGAVRVSHAGQFVRRLRELNIGWGAERYANRFLTVAEDEKYPPDAETLSGWKALIDSMFLIARCEGSAEEQKDAVRDFLGRFAAVKGPEDGAALAAAKRLLESITWLDEGETVLGRLLESVEGSAYLNGHEEPGKLYAVPLSGGFCTGRKTLYVCGMSRFCMQGGRQESPLLLDEEKAAYGLPTITDRERENAFRFALMLAQHEGDVVLSYCDYDTERMIELQPAPVYSELKGSAEAERITYIPATPLTLGDFESTGAAAEILPEPSEAPGEDVEAAVLGDEKDYETRFAEKSFSPSSLEEALACPLKYYLRHILGLYPPELPERSSDAWLNAAEMGSLCHAVLEKYYAGEGGLEQAFASELEEYRKKRPIAAADAMSADIERARAMIARAVRWTESSGHEVLSTEKAFGNNADEEPLRLRIGAKEIGLSGSIDRVDRLPDGTLAVLDYKTGAAKNYREHEEIKLQPYLYARAIEQLDNSARVSTSGYLFLQSSADYLSVSQDTDARALKEKVIESLLTWMQDEERAKTAAPVFVIGGEHGIEGTGTADAREKSYVSDRYRSGCSGWCKYAGLCLAAEQIRGARAAEAADREIEEDEDDE